MRNFLITSVHDVHLDTYDGGQLQWVNSYSLKAEIKAENPREAICKYFENELYYKFSFENAIVGHEDDESNNKNELYFDVLVDIENYEASKNDVELWIEGKNGLYNNSIFLTIHEIIPTTI
jgi:hypothetical protein